MGVPRVDTSLTVCARLQELVKAWAADANIDILSPQLYSSGSEPAPEFACTSNCVAAGCTWSLYAGAKALFVPSIVDGSQLAAVQKYFTVTHNITTAGFIQWKQQAL